MARAREPEVDEELPSPAAQTVLVGHAAAAATLAEALDGRRMHHAWLIGGPRGVGKATLAFRAARCLLAAGEPRGEGEPLALPADSQTARLVAAGAHPDLVVVERPWDDAGKRRKAEIGVAEVRRLIPFFGSTASRGGARVCVVDAADDLNTNAANALLKMLEEPPAGGLFLIVSHAPGRLLPTIRSRCRRLDLAPLSDEEIRDGLARLGLGGDLAAAELDAVVRAAEGSLGRAATLLDPGRVALIGRVDALVRALPSPDRRAVMALGDEASLRGGEEAFDLVVDRVRQGIATAMRAGASAGLPAPALAAWAEVWEKVDRAVGRAEALNLDRKQVVLAIFKDLAEAARSAAASA